jgi:DNA polymerase-4
MGNSGFRVRGSGQDPKEDRLRTPNPEPRTQRIILHLDMDAYFASLEQRDIPAYKGKPLMVCHGIDPSPYHGIVTAASYEARPYGLRSGASVLEARKKCPNGIFVKGNFDKYLETSREIVNLSRRFTDLVEVYSIDEMFLDITNTWHLFKTPLSAAKKIKDLIKQELDLSCSVGIGPNRLVSKMAAGFNKPDGITLIARDDLPEAFNPLPVGELIGIGRRMKKHMNAIGVETIGDLAALPLPYLKDKWGIAGVALHRAARGLDDTPIVPTDLYNDVKSYGHSSSLGKGVKDLGLITEILLGLTEGVTRRMRKDSFLGKTVHLRLGFNRFVYIGRSKSLDQPTDLTQKIMIAALELLADQEIMTDKFNITLIGVSVSNLKQATEGRQVSVFDLEENKLINLNKAMDAVRSKYGEKSIVRGALLGFNKRNYGLSKVEVEEVQSPKTSFKVNNYYK